jgi:hypothetical protein
VANYADHGLLGMTYSAGFIYLAYSVETPGVGDTCTDFGSFDGRPASEIYGCLVYGRFSRVPYDPDANAVVGPEEVIVNGNDMVDNGFGGWMPLLCGQFATHGATAAAAGADGTVYFAAGDGASYQAPDVGQFPNICQDPAAYLGSARAQNPRSLAGKVIRVNPATLQWSIVSGGHRNPFRLTIDPVTDQLWESETGWFSYEEINMLPNLPGQQPFGVEPPVGNFGWPCIGELEDTTVGRRANQRPASPHPSPSPPLPPFTFSRGHAARADVPARRLCVPGAAGRHAVHGHAAAAGVQAPGESPTRQRHVHLSSRHLQRQNLLRRHHAGNHLQRPHVHRRHAVCDHEHQRTHHHARRKQRGNRRALYAAGCRPRLR